MKDIKMDFFQLGDYVKDNYGVEEGYTGLITRTAVIRFDIDDRGDISGTANRVRTYVDRNHIDMVKAGEIWVCNLTPNPNNSNNYFATPIRKVDGDLLMEVMGDRMTTFVQQIYRENETFFQNEFKDIIDEQVQARINTVLEEYRGTFEGRIEELEADNQTLNQALEEKELEIRGLMDELEEKDRAIAERDAVIVGFDHSAEGMVTGTSVETVTVDRCIDGVIRTDAETFVSDHFTHDRYTVLTDMGFTKMVIRPDSDGKVECSDGRIRLNGFSHHSPFTDASQLRFDMLENDSMRIYLA